MANQTLLVNALTIDATGTEQNHQALFIREGKITWRGHQDDLPYEISTERFDCRGALVTPGLIDCHTHLVYAGSRANEYRKRLNGMSYQVIAQQGGGILSSVEQLRLASEEELFTQSLPRIQSMVAQGVTTVEIKSGYGLNLKNELKMLAVAKRLGECTGIRVVKTFLGAHAVPEEFLNRAADYVDYLCSEMLPAIDEAKAADVVDVFSESIGFSLSQTEQIFQCARALDLPIKCHAEQLSNIGASALAASYGALSCDHLEHLDDAGIKAMAEAGTVAVLLPGAFYFLNETKKPPIERMRAAGVGMAIATDCNPGSSPTTSLPLMMSMACRFFSLTIPEAIAGVTTQAARALGLQQTIGTLDVGMHADIVCWSSIFDSADLCYQFGNRLPHKTMIAGQWQTDRNFN